MEESYPRDPHDRTPRCGVGPRCAVVRVSRVRLLHDPKQLPSTSSGSCGPRTAHRGAGWGRGGHGTARIVMITFSCSATAGPSAPPVFVRHIGLGSVPRRARPAHSWSRGFRRPPTWALWPSARTYRGRKGRRPGAVSSSGTRSCWGRRAGGVHERGRDVGATTLHDSVAHDPDDGPAHRRGDAAPRPATVDLGGPALCGASNRALQGADMAFPLGGCQASSPPRAAGRVGISVSARAAHEPPKVTASVLTPGISFSAPNPSRSA